METVQSEHLEDRLAREIAPFQSLGQSEDMEEFYQAVDWVRGNCTFTQNGDVVFHGGTTASVPVHGVKKNTPLYRLLEDEAERNHTHLNKSVSKK